jgi:hypothetical protein
MPFEILETISRVLDIFGTQYTDFLKPQPKPNIEARRNCYSAFPRILSTIQYTLTQRADLPFPCRRND